MDVRAERAGDTPGIRVVHEAAFAPSRFEADLVDALRGSAAWIPDLSLVALDGERVVAHSLLSEVSLGSGGLALALGPVGVRPASQRCGLGGRLVRDGLAGAAATGYPLVVVLGHPAFYPRFGFEPAARLGVIAPFEVPADSWLAHRLPAYHPGARGVVHYPPPWSVQAERACDDP